MMFSAAAPIAQPTPLNGRRCHHQACLTSAAQAQPRPVNKWLVRATPAHATDHAGAVCAAAAAAAILIGLQYAQPEVAWSKPALLDLPSCSRFTGEGPVKFCEVQPGSGDSPLPGDLIVVDYTARAVATGEVYDGSRNFKFTVGQGEAIPGWEAAILGNADIPAIKEGGTRTALIAPELAYGSQGDGCLFGRADNCRIPPNSPVEITFTYRGLGY